MTITAFYEGIGLCKQAKAAALALDEVYHEEACAPAFALFDDPKTWEKALSDLRELCGEDADGMKMFVCLSHCAAQRAQRYRRLGIPEEIYWATMRFLSRFLHADSEKAGHLVFRWAWWFPRQLALKEFRIGAMEYEMLTAEGERRISVHIPADADFSDETVGASLADARAFMKKFFPAFAEAPMYCESWLLSPALRELLPEGSNILRFQRRFDILRVDENSPAALEWIFPDPKAKPEDFPEDTRLRRAAKRYLLAGGNIGRTLGKLRE